MAVRLTVDEAAWSTHVQSTAAATPGIIPVVKGNGYGFGRRVLMPAAAALSGEIAVGTVFEAVDVPHDRTAIVLTPTLDVPDGLPASTVLTVSSIAHVDALARAGWRQPVTVKLASSMQRYGASPPELSAVLEGCALTGLEVAAVSLHPPLHGDDDARLGEVLRWLPIVPDTPLWVSHLGPTALGRLHDIARSSEIRVRVGTALWHGDKSMLHLDADVLDVRPVLGGSAAGYRGATVPDDGWIVLAGAGSAHGVAALDDGRSPFHFMRRRLELLEAPHMHTSMLFVPEHEARAPEVGERLDLQRPLITTAVDEVIWR
jgi:alanine racemase